MRLRSVTIVSSLPLQRLLHFNAYYSLFYAAAEITLTAFKLTQTVLEEKVKYSLPVIVAIFVVAELARLPLGYTGNLKESVSSASAFWLLTLFPQLPVVAYLTIGQRFTSGFLPLDLAVGIMMLVMLLGELYFGYRAIKSFIRKQTSDFARLCREDALLAAAAATAAASSSSSSPFASSSQQIGAYGTALLSSSSVVPATSAGVPRGGGAGVAVPHTPASSTTSARGQAPSQQQTPLLDPSTAGVGVAGIAAMGAKHLISTVTGSFSNSSSSNAGPRQARRGGPSASGGSEERGNGGVEMTASAAAAAGHSKSS